MMFVTMTAMVVWLRTFNRYGRICNDGNSGSDDDDCTASPDGDASKFTDWCEMQQVLVALLSRICGSRFIFIVIIITAAI